MADNTKIEWADATLNYANGCSIHSPGCKLCYAMKQAHRFPVRQGLTMQTKGGMVWTGEVRMNDKALHQAIAWKRGRRIFWNAHGDLFHANVTDEQIDRQFAACALSPQHTHMILTKRSDRMREYMDAKTSMPGAKAVADQILLLGGQPSDAAAYMTRQAEFDCLPNVWLGVSVEDQQRANERVPDLLAMPAAVRFVSAEPLLGPVDFSAVPGSSLRYFHPDRGAAGISWVIIGTESGHHARHMDNAWAQPIVDQCQAAGVAVMVKQLSSGTARPLHDIEQFPEGLRIREFPHHG